MNTIVLPIAIGELFDVICQYGDEWVFRGQSNSSWKLESSLERALSDYETHSEPHEMLAIKKFKASAHHYIPSSQIPESDFGWTALLQHYGVPTRLLDFTESPLIALFFAVSESSTPMTNAALWAIKYTELNKLTLHRAEATESSRDTNKTNYVYPFSLFDTDDVFDKLGHDRDLLLVLEPKKKEDRVERQKGTFLFSCSFKLRIEQLLQTYPNNLVQKIIIPKELIPKLRNLLHRSGFDNRLLFNDIESLAKDVRRILSR